MTDYTGFTTETPTAVNVNNTNFPGMTGERWRVDVNGYVTALRFYKGSNAGGGLHVMMLFDSVGNELARITSSDTTCTVPAWITKTLTDAVAITSVSSYIAATWWAHTNGYYVQTPSLHITSINNPPVYGPVGSVGAHQGLYCYSATPTYPNLNYQETGYFNDFVFTVVDTIPTIAATGVACAASLGIVPVICPTGF